MTSEAQWSQDWRAGDAAITTPDGEAYSCASCGGDLAFAPELDALLCGHCGETRSIPKISGEDRRAALAEIDLTDALRDAALETELAPVRVVKCGSCAAEETFEGTERAKSCPFCGEPLIDEPKISHRAMPKALLPFTIDEAAAKAKLRAWLANRWFAPSSLAKLARSDRPMTGVYAPYFTYDAATDSAYEGARGDAYTDYVWRTVKVDDRLVRRRVAVRKIRWRAARGRVARRFDDVPAPATVGLSAPLLARLDANGWDFDALEPYQPAYLAGFIAENPGVGVEQGFQHARRIMDRVIENDVRRDIGGDAQRIDRVSTKLSEMRFRSILAPVWVASYRYRGQHYQALVNGRTGAIAGDRPYSIWKIALASIAAACLLGVIVLALGANQ